MLNNDKFVFETEVFDNIHRAGIHELMDWLSSATDFYTAPASTRFHGSSPNGLVRHSLSVFENFWKVAEPFGLSRGDGVINESAAICCLFHDLCKANTYKQTYRNVKNEETGIWERIPSYTIEEQLPYGSHGAKSVYLIQGFMKLLPEEAMAIHNHMGAWNTGTYENPGKVYDFSKLAWLVHVADEAATYIDKT